MSSDAAKPAAPAGPAAASKLPLVAILVGALNLGATGFVVTRVIRPAHAAEGASAPSESAGKPESKKAAEGKLVALDPLLVNLNEPGSSRYLKATLEVEVTDDAVEELKASSRAVRDGLLRYLSSLSVADTLGEHAKDKMEAQIVARIDTELGGKKRVKRLFFTEFMVQ